LSDEGKELIIAKLNNMLFFIGADEPHEVDPEDADLIGETVFDTMHNINIRRYEDKIDKLTDGNERNGFIQMSPQTVNACYMPDINSINITLGIMSAPFYDRNNTYWQNLGGIGTVVGHEISHAFDNTGMLYDMYGNYAPDWIPECDRDAFDEMASHISDYYSGLTILDIHPVDGELTLGENLADISGVQCVLEIAENNEQRQQIFEQYALIWGYTMPKDSALDYLYLDVHSPNVIRVNAVVPLFDCFYEIYGVEEGDGMYVAPSDRVRRW
jgi:predicted metalloendopeptidase